MVVKQDFSLNASGCANLRVLCFACSLNETEILRGETELRRMLSEEQPQPTAQGQHRLLARHVLFHKHTSVLLFVTAQLSWFEKLFSCDCLELTE